MKDDKGLVKEAGCVAIGAVIGSASGSKVCLGQVQRLILDILLDRRDRMDVHRALAHGLCLALPLSNEADNVAFFGKVLIDADSSTCNECFAASPVRFQRRFVAHFGCFKRRRWLHNAAATKSLYTKVLTRIKEVCLEN
jgi:hypothetical protein